MARNGSGTYSLPSGNPVVTGTVISSTWANTTLSDIATALTASIAKDGQTTPTANLPMGGYKLTGLAAGTATGDSVRYDEFSAAEPTSFRADNNDVNIATIPDSTWTRIALSTERHDTNSEFASGTFTAKKAGPHRFYFQWSGAAPVANNAMRCRLYKNGTEFAEGRLVLVSGNQQVVSVYSEINLAVSDTIDTYVFHDRGTNQEVQGSVLFTYFTGGFIGAT